MAYLVSITSQGQISIPAAIRRKLGLSTKKKALVTTDGQKVLIEPVEDIFALAGSLAHRAMKGKTLEQIIEIEEKAWEKEAAKRYLKTFKK